MKKGKRPIRVEGDIAYVTLTRGFVAIIDAADVPLVEGFNWTAIEVSPGRMYALRRPQQETIYLHRLLMGLEYGDKRQVDHRDCDTMNNRRANLRIATAAENARNGKIQSNNTSGYIGVTQRSCGKWEAYVHVNRKRIYLGVHASKHEASRVRDVAARHHHGEFARLNNPEG
jgi:hypothetical protein